MPARDAYHNAVIHALNKEGWIIAQDQYGQSLGDRRVWIDLKAEKDDQSLVCLIEIKVFESRSQVEDLAEALGKYLLYQVILAANKDTSPLYLAVPEAAWNGILREELGKRVIETYSIKLLVFNVEREEVTLWFP